MKTINVTLPHASYAITIESGLLDQAGSFLSQLINSRKTVVVTDEIVDRLYGETLTANLNAAGFQVTKAVISPGEGSKSMMQLEQLYNHFLDVKLTRSDLVIAFGGGVVGDLTGFAAATYLRGVPYVQIPTTLLAQIDSSVGGKVAVNLPRGKNLAGAFYQPAAVLIDPLLLDSLPDRVLSDGMAEAIKYGAIADRLLFDRLAACRNRQDVLNQAEDIIAACCRIKRDVVETDEKDTGRRMILNFGHTIGHAIEQYYRYETYTHGEAVAIGMIKISERSELFGLSQPGTAAELREVIGRHGLPVKPLEWTKAALLATIGLDKKNTDSGLQLVILPAIGRSEIIKVALSDAAAYL